jgi:hypothetical protein
LCPRNNLAQLVAKLSAEACLVPRFFGMIIADFFKQLGIDVKSLAKKQNRGWKNFY